MLWVSCGSCSGESMALLGVDGQATDLLDLLEHDGVRLLWHPSLSLDPLAPIVRQVLDEVLPLTLLCVVGFGLFGTSLIMPLFFQTIMGMTAYGTGLALLPGAIATAVAMPIVPRLMRIIDVRWLLTNPN